MPAASARMLGGPAAAGVGAGPRRRQL